jgi:secreted trypsin-like serine protease
MNLRRTLPPFLTFLLPLLLTGLLLGRPLPSAVDASPLKPAAVTVTPTLTTGPARPQIVGGEPAESGAIPWQVALLSGSAGWQFCGGTIIAANWVLTAAHCVDDQPEYPAANTLSVLAGTLSLSPYDSSYQRLNVQRVIVHPSYNRNTLDNDIALLRLTASFSWSATVAPLTLIDEATLSYVGTGAPALVSGWGTLASGGSSPNELYQVIVPIVDQTVCNDAYGGSITNNMLCAGYMAGGKDSCQGDSGGPLAVPVGDGWRLAGVVSWGTGCAWENYPGIYTRVSQYRSWVEARVSSLVPTVGPSPTAQATATIAPTAVPTAAPTATPLPPTAVPQLDTVQNSGFEEPETGWTEQTLALSGLIYQSGASGLLTPYAGLGAAALGRVDDEQSILSQALISSEFGGMLSYRYQIRSEDICINDPDFWYDSAAVTVEILGPAQDGGPAPTAPLQIDQLQLCSGTVTNNWVERQISLHDYGNAVLKLGFLVTTDYSFTSSLFVDDVRYQPFVTRLLIPSATR